MSSLIDRLCRFLEFLIAVGLAAMVILVFSNVVLRYGFNSSIVMSEEVSRWLFIWMTFLGALVAMHEHGHLGVDLVVSKLPRLGRKACLIVSHLIMLGIVLMLFVGGLEQTQINWDISAPTTGASMAIVHMSSVVFSVIATIILLNDLYRILTTHMSDHDLIMIQESEEADQLRQVLGEQSAVQDNKP